MEGLPRPTGPEIEETKEIPSQYEVGVLLGEQFKDLGTANALTVDAKIRTLAAGMLAENGKIGELVISGGRIAGLDKPSIAAGMKEYLLKKFPTLSGFPITLEEDSIDTSENAEYVAEILAQKEARNAVLITSFSHMRRAEKLFREYGIDVYDMAAEYELAGRSHHHKKFIEKYLGSGYEIKKELVEAMIRSLMVVDRSHALIRSIARKRYEK